MSVVIDSTTYDVPFKVIDRSASTVDKYAERTEDGVLHRELIGVYFIYKLEFGMSLNNVTDYAALWLKLTEAAESHEITLLGDTYDCYFPDPKDKVVKIKNGSTYYYRDLSVTVIPISPTRTPA
ncbi:MAG: hypothetical protein EHM33_00920 [Chloroflexi bacterium]|nr:MAG: hypothetical protein EHM33_00920 [Chloroflexota bacterium]